MRKMSRKEIQNRSIKSKIETRSDESEGKIIEGYFAVFGKETKLWEGCFEEIDKNAFQNTLSSDVRALINHDSKYVLGRTKSATLELRVDSFGLFGKIKINENDSDAMNLYARVKRGDIDQCSFGFEIVKESTEVRDDGSCKWTIEDVILHEVSICTFPAYEDTSVQAREKQYKEIKNRSIENWKTKSKERVKKYVKKTNAN